MGMFGAQRQALQVSFTFLGFLKWSLGTGAKQSEQDVVVRRPKSRHRRIKGEKPANSSHIYSRLSG